MQLINPECASYEDEHDGQKHEGEEEGHATIHGAGPLTVAGNEIVGEESDEDDKGDDLEDEPGERDVDTDLDIVVGPGDA